MQELRFLDAMMADHELPMTARIVGYLLVRWTNGNKAHRFAGYAWAGREKLAEWIGRESSTTITTATNVLKARGYIIVKRRPNATNLIRPNWDRVVPRQGATPEDQETAFPEGKFSVRPDDQETGPYSADHDSADRDSGIIPERSASGMSETSSKSSASGAGRHGNDNPRPGYKQTKAEADRTFDELRSMPFRTEWEGAEIELSAEAPRAEKVHWHKLLKAGLRASHILKAADHFLATCPDNQRPSLARFLGTYAQESCTDPDSNLYVPDDEQSDAANDNVQPPKANVSGDEIDVWV
ncbi:MULTISPECIES: hypothetical protein [unclassified Bradyrhizobium]|uniref:hypothetical protein n=1 Tax=unclassified Bradyrhizobium TaxID=2631580 RepID=UPI002916E32C|nr:MULTISPECIES: hypothetical protein [unclassified Bradyrhizobium]